MLALTVFKRRPFSTVKTSQTLVSRFCVYLQCLQRLAQGLFVAEMLSSYRGHGSGTPTILLCGLTAISHEIKYNLLLWIFHNRGSQGTNCNQKYTIRSIVCEASCHSVTRSLAHLVTRSLGHSVLGHSVTRSLGHLVTWSLGHLVTWFLGHLVIRSLFSTLLLTN